MGDGRAGWGAMLCAASERVRSWGFLYEELGLLSKEAVAGEAEKFKQECAGPDLYLGKLFLRMN